ncbi:hypothetical protein BDL97_09G014200 [Sphagnum fallax]|nr:hypothetical protein BDL97_09G014200 [Sphagnum fallax]
MANAADRLTKLMRMSLRSAQLGVHKSRIPSSRELQQQQLLKQDRGVVAMEGAANSNLSIFASSHSARVLKKVSALMHEAIHMKKTDMPDKTLSQLREEYLRLDEENRRRALVVLATKFGVDRERVQGLLQHYSSLKPVEGAEDETEETASDCGVVAARYRVERDLRAALVPLSSRLFDQINGQAGGLKFLVDLRADLKASLQQKNLASLRALDSDLKGMFATWLGPACLELHQITWNDPACLLEKIVTYEAVHPISNLYDLKRRLGTGRRCFGFFHPAMPGEPLVFIEVALTNNTENSIQKVLFDEAICEENQATTALLYSISSTQPGLAGIDLGNFLIKRVICLLQHDMPHIQTFVTLSPIPGFLQWLLPKLALQSKPPGSNFREELLLPVEEESLKVAYGGTGGENVGAVIMYDLLSSPQQEWIKSGPLVEALRTPLMRICARYILQEKKRGAALDYVTNFHVRNGASVEQLNWMGDTSDKGLERSAGIMVNYLYRLEKIEENNQAYLNKGTIAASPAMEQLLEPLPGTGLQSSGNAT